MSISLLLLAQVRNAEWQSMRFSQLLSTSEPLDRVRQLIMDNHSVVSSQGLKLFLGTECEDENLLRPEDYGLTLSDLSVAGGSPNDHVAQVITYQYAPYKGSHSILNLPRNTAMAPLKISMR